VARLPRVDVAQWPHLIVQRAIDGDCLVIDADDRKALWQAMVDAARACDVAVHAYAIVSDHFLLLATPAEAGSLGDFMQAIGRRYVAAFNRRHARAGRLWEGRFRATVIDAARYLLDAMVFVELHDSAAGVQPGGANLPGLAWGHSSRFAHLNQRSDPLVLDHAMFWRLGNTPFDREAAWRKRLDAGLNQAQHDAFAKAMHKGWALVDAKELPVLESVAGRRLSPRPRGRPRRNG
jgi:putative transposase